jgi:hypothetical protein
MVSEPERRQQILKMAATCGLSTQHSILQSHFQTTSTTSASTVTENERDSIYIYNTTLRLSGRKLSSLRAGSQSKCCFALLSPTLFPLLFEIHGCSLTSILALADHLGDVPGFLSSHHENTPSMVTRFRHDQPLSNWHMYNQTWTRLHSSLLPISL